MTEAPKAPKCKVRNKLPEGANENDSHSHLEQKSTFLRRNENDSHSHLPLERETANENDSHSHLGVWVL